MAAFASTMPRVPRRRMKVAAGIAFAFFVAYFDRTNVTVLIANHHFDADLGITGSKFKQGLLLSAFLFPYGFANFVTGPLGDKIGGRRGVTFAVLSWTVVMTVMGFTSSFAVMIALRVLLGLGESIMTPACNMIIAQWFPDRERSRANSVWLGGLFLAPAISYPILVLIVDDFGWRSTFFLLAAVGFFVALPMVWFWTTDRPEDAKGLSPIELSYIRDGQAATKVFDGDTIRRQAKMVFSNHKYWLGVIGYTGYGLGFWGVSAFVPSYFEHVRHLSFSSSGLFAVLPWVAATVLNFVGGWSGDRKKRWRVSLWSLGYIAAAGLSLLGIATGSAGGAIVLISLAVGFMAFTLGPMWAIAQELSRPAVTGLTSGVWNGVSYIVSAFGPGVVGYIADSTGSYSLGFLAMAAFLVAMAIVITPLRHGQLAAAPGFGRGDRVAAEPPDSITQLGDRHDCPEHGIDPDSQ